MRRPSIDKYSDQYKKQWDCPTQLEYYYEALIHYDIDARQRK